MLQSFCVRAGRSGRYGVLVYDIVDVYTVPWAVSTPLCALRAVLQRANAAIIADRGA